MPSIKPIKIEDFGGGIYTEDPTSIPDNALEEATNMFYDSDKVLTVRRGSSAFGLPIPDAVTLINDCNATTNFAVAQDGANLALGSAIRGTNSVSFDIDVSVDAANSATLSNSTLGAISIASTKGAVSFFLFVPAGFNTALTSVKFRLGSDSSNYYEWTLPELTEDASNHVSLNYGDAVATGTPNDASINYMALVVAYAAGYTDKLGVRVDSIYSSSATSSEGAYSLQFHEATDGVRYLLANAGTTLFLYQESTSSWEPLATGLTAERFKSVLFRDVIYLTKRSDDYRSFNGTTFTTYPSVPRAEDMLVANDVGYLAVVDTDPSTVFYTDSSPTDLTTFPNDITVDEDNGQRITGIDNIGPIVLPFKERSTYQYNVAGDAVSQITYSGGLKALRGTARVGDDLYILSNDGVYSLAERTGTTGSLGSNAASMQIKTLLESLTNLDIGAMIYWPQTSNLYLSIDDTNDGANSAIYVYSLLTKAWTKWTGVSASEFCLWIDSEGNEHLLAANSFGGQVVELESVFDDLGVAIEFAITTKTYDFSEPGRVLLYSRADIGGYHTEGMTTSCAITCVNAAAATANKTIQYQEATDKYADQVADSLILGTLGAKTLASTPFGGGVEGTVDSSLQFYDFFRYMPICLTGRHIKFRLTGSCNGTSFALTKLHIHPTPLPRDFVPNSLYT